MTDRIYSLNIPAGIQQDGTELAKRYWSDGEWARFQRQLPQKMGGYQQIGASNELVRGTYVVSNPPNFNIYYGTASQLNFFLINQNYTPVGGTVNKTPVPFQVDPNNDWQFDIMYSTVDTGSILIAFAAPNLASIDSVVDRPIFYGDPFDTNPLVPTGHFASGGICVLHPYLFFFGNNGEVTWTEANNPTQIVNTARVTGSKICYGLPTRGGNLSPAGLLWSLDSLIRVTFSANSNDPADFRFDTITSESSLLSSRGIIEQDGIYYWCATDRFLAYNGVCQEMPNDMNINFFFRNVNYAQRQKVWATKVTQYGEIWWFFPTGNNVECNHAVVYNYREKTWYNTPVSSSDGHFDQTLSKPIWASVDQHAGAYPLFAQEIGRNKVFLDGTTETIRSSIKTPALSWCTVGADGKRNETDRWTELYRIEPDLIQVGNMTVRVSGPPYARGTNHVSAPYTFTPTTEKIDMREQRREMYLEFVSNEMDGYYEFGQILVVGKIGDARQ